MASNLTGGRAVLADGVGPAGAASVSAPDRYVVAEIIGDVATQDATPTARYAGTWRVALGTPGGF